MRASRGARERGELRPALFSAIETVIGEWTRVASCFLFDCTHKAEELFIRVTFNRGIIFFPPRGIASRFRKITMLRIVSSRAANGMCFNVNRRGEHPFVRFREATENRAREQSAPGIGIGIHLNIKHGRHIGRLVLDRERNDTRQIRVSSLDVLLPLFGRASMILPLVETTTDRSDRSMHPFYFPYGRFQAQLMPRIIRNIV